MERPTVITLWIVSRCIHVWETWLLNGKSSNRSPVTLPTTIRRPIFMTVRLLREGNKDPDLNPSFWLAMWFNTSPSSFVSLYDTCVCSSLFMCVYMSLVQDNNHDIIGGSVNHSEILLGKPSGHICRCPWHGKSVRVWDFSTEGVSHLLSLIVLWDWLCPNSFDYSIGILP